MKKTNTAAGTIKNSGNNSNQQKPSKATQTMKTIDPTPNFATATVDPATLVVHQLVSDMGYARTPDEDFNSTAAHFDFYKKPVVDRHGCVITNHQEVLAAVANDIKELEAFVCDLEGIELRRFISFTHRYYRKDLRASYATICFYQEYFETPEGSALAASIDRSTTRGKIAYLMNTSDATVKRLMQVGRLKYEKLGLIEQGETSFKEVLTGIKLETLAANGEKKRIEEEAARLSGESTTTDAGAPFRLDPNDDLEEEGNDELFTVPGETDIDPSRDPGKKATIIPMPVPVTQPQPKRLNLVKGSFEIEGLGTVELKFDGGRALILVNGEEGPAVDYSTHAMEQSYLGAIINTFTFAAPGASGMTINLSVEQPAAQLRKAA